MAGPLITGRRQSEPFGFTTGSNSGCNSGPQASPRKVRPISARSWARRLGATLGDRSCTSLGIENEACALGST
jgi:hypothetical protein